jgi:hypothetical protein
MSDTIAKNGEDDPERRPLVERIFEEADLCRTEGADDIAKLLDEAASAVAYYKAGLCHTEPAWVPAEVWLPVAVRGDRPFGHTTIAAAGVHACLSNRNGAISVLAQNGQQLGVKPAEFEVVRWRMNTPVK